MTRATSADALTDAGIQIDVLEGATAFRDLLTSRFGPTGRKLLVVGGDGAVVTSDLHRLLDTIELDHPVARLVAAGAVEQKETIGDGSLAVVLLVGGLAERAQDLLDRGVQRATIAEGFARAGQVGADRLGNYSRVIEDSDDHVLEGVARGSLASSTAETEPGVLDAVSDAARLLYEARDGRGGLKVDDVEFRHVEGQGPNAELIRGTVVDKSPVSETTPTEFEGAAIAVIGGGRKAGSGIEERSLKRQGGEPGKGRTEVEFTPETPEDITAFREAEVAQVDDQIDALLATGADVVFCTMGISRAAQARLEAEGIPAFRALTGEQSRRLARAVGARVVMHLEDIDAADLGRAGALRVITEDEETHVRIEDCPSGEVATLLLTGGVGESIEELERDLRAAIVSTHGVMNGGPVVPGGGNIEVALASEIRGAARGVSDRTAVAMDAYADALEDIPRILAKNAGADPIDVLMALRTRGVETTFDALHGEVRPVEPDGPYVPERVVRSTVTTATELAVQLSRIDDVLAATDEEDDAITDVDFRPKPDRDL